MEACSKPLWRQTSPTADRHTRQALITQFVSLCKLYIKKRAESFAAHSLRSH